MLITHHGHSEFLIETAEGFRILTDPFDEHVGYGMREVECDAVTVSHGHGDHSYTKKVSGSAQIMDTAGSFAPAEGVKITGIPCFHDDCSGAKRGPNLIYIIEAEGLRVAHLGDLGAWDKELLDKLGKIDIALVPVGGFFTIDADSAKQMLDVLKPRMVIPMHYRTGANAGWPIAPLEDFLKAMNATCTPMPLLRVTAGDLSQQPRVAVLADKD